MIPGTDNISDAEVHWLRWFIEKLTIERSISTQDATILVVQEIITALDAEPGLRIAFGKAIKRLSGPD